MFKCCEEGVKINGMIYERIFVIYANADADKRTKAE